MGQPVTVLLANPMDDFEVAYDWLGANGVTLPCLLDPGGTVYNAYGPIPDAYAPFPRQVVIDQDGVIRYLSGQYDAQAVRAAIDALLP